LMATPEKPKRRIGFQVRVRIRHRAACRSPFASPDPPTLGAGRPGHHCDVVCVDAVYSGQVDANHRANLHRRDLPIRRPDVPDELATNTDGTCLKVDLDACRLSRV